jgi:hypothetical protein
MAKTRIGRKCESCSFYGPLLSPGLGSKILRLKSLVNTKEYRTHGRCGYEPVPQWAAHEKRVVDPKIDGQQCECWARRDK